MSAEALIEFASGPLERIPADLAVVAVTTDERPFRGGAGRVDWRLCSLLSELALEGHVTGTLGEAVLLPGIGRLSVGRILIIGAGARDELGAARVRELVETAVGRSLELGAARVALPALGWSQDDWPRLAEPVLAGLADALAGGAEGQSIQLRLDIPHAIAGPTLRAFNAARLSHPDPGLRVQLPTALPSPPEGTADAAHHHPDLYPEGSRRAGPAPISPASSRY
ncbi:MAG: M17 family peptidase N-terminal domain-containing protein [Myxococcota bacterium]